MLANILSIHQLVLILVQVMDVCYHLRRGEGREGGRSGGVKERRERRRMMKEGEEGERRMVKIERKGVRIELTATT